MTLMRVAWRTVGAIAARVVADGRAAHDPFDGLARIGIDEISYRRGHQYLMVVVDHDTGRLVWAKAGLIACVYRAAEWRHKAVELAAHDLSGRPPIG